MVIQFGTCDSYDSLCMLFCYGVSRVYHLVLDLEFEGRDVVCGCCCFILYISEYMFL